MSDRILHTRADSARSLSISVRKLDELIAEKRIRIVKIGRRTLVTTAELLKFANRGTGVR
jgi:excisionase family DNA binding protein